MSDRASVSATVTLTIEIDSFSSWGTDCRLEQVERQASQEVISAIEKACRNAKVRARLVSRPVVQAVIVRREKP